MLLLFAIAKAINIENNLALDQDCHAPLQKLTITDTPPRLHNQYPWGYPLYVLESKAQTFSKGLPK